MDIQNICPYGLPGGRQRHADRSSISTGAGLGEDENWLSDVASTPRTASSDLRSRRPWHHGVARTLVELIRIHKESLNSSSGEIGGSTVRPPGRFAAVAKLM